ncbi:MAG: hypothetical protein ACRCWR_10680 [Saezia sp.]
MIQPTNDVDEKEAFIKKRLNAVVDSSPIIELPPAFKQLHQIQQKDAINRLQKLTLELQQALLDDWGSRIQKGGIQHQAGYLFKLLALAENGEYIPSILEKEETPTPDVHYQYKTQNYEAEKSEAQVIPQQEAAEIARNLRDREKAHRAQKNLSSYIDKKGGG